VSRVALLDVNLLVALFDPDHVHHDLAHDWFADHRAGGWATCPVTENGFFRVLGNPLYARLDQRPADLVERLVAFRKSGHHHFWPDSVSITDERLFNPLFVRGHRQITDIYLLGLARRAGGSLATFDRTIPLRAVVGATRATLQIVGPAPDAD
jgi:toxin-antitoxin system PIN domain toxin